MPFCPKCGFEVAIDDNFCAKCGAILKHTDVLSSDSSAQKTLPESDKSEENYVDWVKKTDEKKSFWSVTKQSLRHIFYDNEEKISNKRKTINYVLAVLVLLMLFWILTPILSSTKIVIGQNGQTNSVGECKYRLDAASISITQAVFSPDNLTMSVLVTNDKGKDVILQSIAKTYEFRFDNGGDTDVEDVSKVIPEGKTLSLVFSVKQEPYILGFDFSNCEKKKVSDWDVITS